MIQVIIEIKTIKILLKKSSLNRKTLSVLQMTSDICEAEYTLTFYGSYTPKKSLGYFG